MHPPGIRGLHEGGSPLRWAGFGRESRRVRGACQRPSHCVLTDAGRGRGLGGEASTVREDEQAAVEALPKFHATARVGAAAGQLHPAGAEADGVVVGGAARVPTAQPGGEVARGRAPGAPGVSGRPREARVEVSEEGGEKGIGRLERGDGPWALLIRLASAAVSRPARGTIDQQHPSAPFLTASLMMAQDGSGSQGDRGADARLRLGAAGSRGGRPCPPRLRGEGAEGAVFVRPLRPPTRARSTS